MRNNNKWFKLTKNLKSSLLVDEQDTLLTRFMKVKDIHKLHKMISLQKIDRNNCLFRSGLQLLRWFVFFPTIILLFINFMSFSHNFHNSWEHDEKEILSTINEINMRNYSNESVFGYYFNKKDDGIFKEKQANYLGGDKKMDLKEYMYFRYNIYAYGHRYFITDIIHVVCFFIFVPLFFYLSFLIKNKAPLILIRDKKLFITWINGKAFVARYSQVGVVETHQAVSLILYGLNKDKHIIKTAFVLPTNPTFIMSSSQGRKDLLAFITKYMVWGLSAVASTEYERNMPYYLRKDKKPDDFDQQVDEILAVLDKLDSSRELNNLTHIKGK